MTAVRIGIQTRSLAQPLRKAVVTAARLGAQGVEIDARSELPSSELSRTGLREFRKLLDDLDLRVSAISFPTRRGFDTLEDLERRILATQAAMRMASDLGARVVIVRIGRVAASAEETSQVLLKDSLQALGAYGDRVGARLAAQTIDQIPQDLARLLEELPEQSMGVDFHPSGLLHGGHSVVDAVETLGAHVLHVHACDAVRDVAARRAVDVELGRGSANLPEVLGRLTEFDYRGWVTIERRDAADPVDEIENAVAYLRSI